MKLIVGLGNPGRIYAGSRHNIGYSVVKLIAQDYGVTLKKESRIPALSGRFSLGNEGVLLALPLTFMNLSGLAVSSLVKKYKISLGNLLVVCDDLDLEFGRIRLKDSGSSAGHRGVESVIEALKSSEFSRLRIGIGRPTISPYIDVSEYVLSPFTETERKQVRQIIEKAVASSQAWVTKGITETMDIFNCRNK